MPDRLATGSADGTGASAVPRPQLPGSAGNTAGWRPPADGRGGRRGGADGGGECGGHAQTGKCNWVAQQLVFWSVRRAYARPMLM